MFRDYLHSTQRLGLSAERLRTASLLTLRTAEIKKYDELIEMGGDSASPRFARTDEPPRWRRSASSDSNK